ncbi:hypothetical protein A9X03_01455 [Mycobacterium sp. E1715]|nr:hypothetical protein [Mycobacterium sp. E1715]OBH26047.1 hypothetical protein A9X03_01455 [Mycobacterium sp. E1715]
MAIGNDETVTAKDVERAERRAAEARERAAHAGLSAARSLEESALQHERIARVQDRSVEQRVSDVGAHQKSAIHHREFAAEDRKLAELKRSESEADLALDADY